MPKKTYPDALIHPVGTSTLNDSLTKREYFAAMAMQGLLGSRAPQNEMDIADASLAYAYALIKVLNE